MRLTQLIASALVFLFCNSAMAVFEPLFENGEWSAQTGAEYRYFKDPGDSGQGQNAIALRLSAEYYTSWNDDQDLLTFTPYLILDGQDEERTHADIRELLWVHVADDWELRSGITRVFWGRTEFNHLVDSINQLDLVDGDDEKLGQPMINLSVVDDWGIFDFYLLLGFRERTYPGLDGRLRTPIPVDTDNARYSADTSPQDVDFAFRWQRPLNDYVEAAFSVFSGVDREPWYSWNFNLNNPMLVPNYQHKDQFGLELEYIYEGWAVKFEGIGVRSSRENYHAMVAGVEYGFYGLFGSNIDMTLITEYMYDSRDDATPGFLEHDVGIGGRFNFNDEFGTAMLGGILWDPDSEEKVISFEYERRIFSDVLLEIQAVTVLERAQRVPRNQTTAQAISSLINSTVINPDDFDYREIVDFLSDLVDENGYDFIFDPAFGLDVIQEFQRLSDTGRK
ncbi:MAG: hypothetical protein WBA20_17985, partial [Ketobacter sp.]